MTGRRLYDRACDARAHEQPSKWGAGPQYIPENMVAWPFLHRQERVFWNDLARRVTPRSRKS